ncbi:MAG: NTP transferase domain-containing protein [Anaerolineales bacterium]|nr:NTP transferase domain-containing protein [Anaerolineales bacterium]
MGKARLGEILIVTGAEREKIEGLVAAFSAEYPLRTVHNKDYAQNEMLLSLQVGLANLAPEAEAALVVLGDQPQIQPGTISLIIETYLDRKARLVIPSFQKRRGHPWLVDRQLWKALLNALPGSTPRDFLDRHKTLIEYISVKTDTILQDIDTPGDYKNYQKQA